MTHYFSKHTYLGSIFVGVLLVIFLYLGFLLFSPPSTFPSGQSFVIKEGLTIKEISYMLRREGYIRSGLFFRALLSFANKDENIRVGYYYFEAPLPLFSFVETIIQDGPTAPLAKVTIPEGSSDKEVFLLVKKALPSLSATKFTEAIAKNGASGLLFPETYELLPSMTEEDVVKRMKSLFMKKFRESFDGVAYKSEIVILASIIEGEARDEEHMRIVSGILQKRLSVGMPLQVDVSKETYKARGLPDAPINNPGLLALDAAINPTKTPYFYYITGNDGKMYYAKTFDEHKANIKKYLK